MVGTQEALSRQRGRGAHNLSAQRRKQRNVCFRAWIGPETREVKACKLDLEDAPRKARSTQVKRHVGENRRVPNRGTWLG